MADVTQDLQRIMNARYGRDVRQSIHDAIYDMNVESTHAEEVAISSQSSAQNNAILAESYTKGGTGTRTGEDTDNAEYYKNEAERLAGVYAVEDNLTSTSTIHSLSANQGRVLDGKITDINNSVGAANGIASLDATGRVPSSQIPLSAMEYKGTWDASTNTPQLTQGVGTNGDFYVVSVAGTWDSTTFNVGDQLIFDADQGTTGLWVRVSGGNVVSVNGQVGAVQIDADGVPVTSQTFIQANLNNVEEVLEHMASTPNGHVVKNQGGTSLTQRPTMKFLDATPSDDSTNSITNIEVVKQVTASELASMPDGIYETTDESDGLISAEDVAYSSSQNVKQKIDSIGTISTLINNSEVTVNNTYKSTGLSFTISRTSLVKVGQTYDNSLHLAVGL